MEHSPELSEAPAWRVTAFESGTFDLVAAVAAEAGNAGSAPAYAILLRAGGSPQERWVLVGDESIRVNGTPLASGIRVLEHRDEIHLGENPPVYFSTERPARVEPFPGAERPIRCPRCRLEIRPGDPAVCCPKCAVSSHESEEYHCWTYPGAETCASCRNQPNTLDDALNWVPEE
jgi:hypothetical protein